MKVVRTIREMQRLATQMRARGKLGFVPTMGALHQGHLELVRVAQQRCDGVVVSIFVNPMQFGPKEDYQRYPRDFARDRKLLREIGVDVIFYPDVHEMYPENYSTYVEVEGLTQHLCGKSRPGHFRGVATVVAKLFNIVKPHIAVFGQKDAQQAFVIKRMVRDLNFDIEIVVVPTVREPDGLAMSSRNSYLTPDERQQAVVLYKALRHAEQLIKDGERDARKVKRAMRRIIQNSSSGRIDYIEIVDTDYLKPIQLIKNEILIALAVYFGKARLIDNLIVRV
ncbi:MAG: pantoate--beta-alanine ligase [candidate division WOR-3 bacterium]|nr:pantoate--beta-alanine ligase [candidate division WOR-3 bacterium]MCR4423493.1 pantoate--beta-alanine ligase [candidate division WOR-3 bacterium]MDH7518832.1 pantoate--beta-alanine ligase [bacterium]